MDPLRETLIECVQYLRPTQEQDLSNQFYYRCATCGKSAARVYMVKHELNCLFIRVQKMVGL